MPKWLDSLLESKKDKQIRQFGEFAETDEFRSMLRQQATELIEESKNEAERQNVQDKENHRKRLEDAEKSISTISKDMEESSEPYVIIRSLGFTSENGIEIKLDFNPAFIKYLAASGIKGHNEDDTIRRWLSYLSYDIMQEGIAEDYILNGVSEDEVPKIGLEELLDEIQEEQEDEKEFDSGWE